MADPEAGLLASSSPSGSAPYLPLLSSNLGFTGPCGPGVRALREGHWPRPKGSWPRPTQTPIYLRRLSPESLHVCLEARPRPRGSALRWKPKLLRRSDRPLAACGSRGLASTRMRKGGSGWLWLCRSFPRTELGAAGPLRAL